LLWKVRLQSRGCDNVSYLANKLIMNILIITDYLPYPLISGDRIRVYNLIRRIAKHHRLWLAAALATPDDAESVAHLQEFCGGIETGYLGRRHPLMHLPGLLRFAFGGKPLELKFLHSAKLAKKIRQLVSRVNFDVVQIEPSRMGLYLEGLPTGLWHKSILVFHNVASYQFDSIFQIERMSVAKMRTWLYSRMMQRWEPRYAERFGSCITVSEEDRDLLITANPRLRVNVIPNGVDTQMYQPLSLEKTEPALLFIGSMDYAPCIDAALYFCHEILPHVRAALGGVQVWIVGKNPVPEVVRLNGDGVHVTGRVNDVVPYYKQTTVSIVPLRAGGGTRLKILESMALGRPVVSTTLGCEGLDVANGQHLLMADQAEKFGEQVVRLLTDRSLYQHIVAEARQLVVGKYDWDSLTQRLLDIYAG
jgi:sugar transferase (PEP-CTERM/EpsH1 system associated)